MPERLTAGVDEAGRGPLAGPVVAAAVILDPARPIAGLRDSKKLSAAQRERLYPLILERALGVGFALATAAEIDHLNIFHATFLAMRRALDELRPRPDHVLVDGKFCPEVEFTIEAVIKGDATVPAISAASIIAKVSRDRIMCELHQSMPQYGFARHKGYPTADHLSALVAYGPCPEHRRSFAPVRRALSRM